MPNYTVTTKIENGHEIATLTCKFCGAQQIWVNGNPGPGVDPDEPCCETVEEHWAAAYDRQCDYDDSTDPDFNHI
jgi:hypothetical protein